MNTPSLPTELAAHLTTARFGRVHEHHAELPSTNDRALAWLSAAEAPAVDGALVTADAQTAGRGRLGRPWSSPAGRDLYASLILRPGTAPAGFGALALAVGVGLREGLLRALVGADLGTDLDKEIIASRLALKWPNDVLLAGRKLAGILCESRWRGGSVDVVVGFGINVLREREQFDPQLRTTATSLAAELPPGRCPSRAAVLAAVLHELERWIERFFAGGFPAVRARYEAHCAVLGREVEVEGPDGRREAARAEGLDDDGALRVRPLAGGASMRVESADVWLKPS